MADQTHSGGCMCGAVRFRAEGEPLRVGLCHCETCRRNTGAPFGAFAVFRRDRVTIELGDSAYFQSSPTGRRHFCPDCGSPVFGLWLDSDDIDIYLGSLDAPERLAPSYELWTVRRQPWLPDMPDLVGYERNSPE